MTNQHPITPPPELVQNWLEKASQDIGSTKGIFNYCANQAAPWGADQELEACCEWLVNALHDKEMGAELRAARRPKPPSLKEQALELLPEIESEDVLHLCPLQVAKIRRALETIND
jgi:hypothetical protein